MNIALHFKVLCKLRVLDIMGQVGSHFLLWCEIHTKNVWLSLSKGKKKKKSCKYVAPSLLPISVNHTAFSQRLALRTSFLFPPSFPATPQHTHTPLLCHLSSPEGLHHLLHGRSSWPPTSWWLFVSSSRDCNSPTQDMASATSRTSSKVSKVSRIGSSSLRGLYGWGWG